MDVAALKQGITTAIPSPFVVIQYISLPLFLENFPLSAAGRRQTRRAARDYRGGAPLSVVRRR